LEIGVSGDANKPFSNIRTNTPYIVGTNTGGGGDALVLGYSSSDISKASPAVTIDKNGNVGIGTTSPSVKLHLSDSFAKAGDLGIELTDSSALGSSLGLGDGTSVENEFIPTVWGKQVGTSDGRVGLLLIGQLLSDTSGNAGVVIDGRSDKAPITTANIFQVRNYGLNLMTVNNNGNVGIGTAKPTEKLEVAGNVKANRFVGNVISAFPRGAIIMWYGDPKKIPEGWALCDGKNGTPNLMGRFIRAAAKAGGTGGSAEHAHTCAAAGGHSHKCAAAGDHRHYYSGTTSIPNARGDGEFDNDSAHPEHTHTYEGYTHHAGNHTHTIHGVDHHAHGISKASSIPPYFDLVFIMKL
jgi:hypothetical protein